MKITISKKIYSFINYGSYSKLYIMNERVKYDKTAKSKNIIIMAKDKKIKELEKENKKLKEQLEILRGKSYEII